MNDSFNKDKDTKDSYPIPQMNEGKKRIAVYMTYAHIILNHCCYFELYILKGDYTAPILPVHSLG